MPNNVEKSAVSVTTLEEMADRMVGAEIKAAGLKRPFAQREISLRAGMAASAVENFQRGRLKNVQRISGPIKTLYAAFLERQIEILRTDLAYARASEPDRDFREVEAAIATGRAALGKPKDN
jgi:transcriptional regulator with XRE-family HTH domain